MFDTIAETESYKITTNRFAPFNSILVRKRDNHYCYLSDDDTDRLFDILDTRNNDEFTIICNSFVFTDPVVERNIC